MRTLKLTIAYDGTSYAGWQRQTNGLSIQQLIEDAFIPLVGAAERRPSVAGAGRTDAGVHAAAQIASVTVDVSLTTASVQRALNFRLPLDVRVLAVEDVPLGFNARFHARSKAYRYRLATRRVPLPFDRAFTWHVPWLRDIDAMRQAARGFVGRHDFASFQARGSSTTDTVRTIERLDVTDAGGEVVVDVEGDGFLRHMVRAMVGTLVDVGAGVRTPGTIDAILEARDRQVAGPTAPARGLMLMAVRY
jgi:tRNA pseudouridine38-40 synthase